MGSGVGVGVGVGSGVGTGADVGVGVGARVAVGSGVSFLSCRVAVGVSELPEGEEPLCVGSSSEPQATISGSMRTRETRQASTSNRGVFWGILHSLVLMESRHHPLLAVSGKKIVYNTNHLLSAGVAISGDCYLYRRRPPTPSHRREWASSGTSSPYLGSGCLGFAVYATEAGRLVCHSVACS